MVTERSCRFFVFVRVGLGVLVCLVKVVENINIFGCLYFKYVIVYGVLEIKNSWSFGG